MPRPNLFVIGAMKSATSSLHTELGRHPEVFMSPFKEPAYFLGPTAPTDAPALSDVYRNDVNRYLALFAGSGSRLVRGESTTDYSKRPRFTGVASRILEFEPQARLIYLIRDPVERTISHYWWAVSREGETRPMLEAIAQEPLYREVSYYAWQLEPYFAEFPREQILIETTEAFSAQPEAVLHRVFSWLQVRPDATLAPPHPPENVTPSSVVQTRSRLLQRLRHSAAGDVLTRITPAPLRRAARRLAEREIDRNAAELKAVYEYLRPLQQKQTEDLSDMLGRRFSEWRTLYNAHAR